MKLYLIRSTLSYIKFSKTFKTVKYLIYLLLLLRKEYAIYENKANRITIKNAPGWRQTAQPDPAENCMKRT